MIIIVFCIYFRQFFFFSVPFLYYYFLFINKVDWLSLKTKSLVLATMSFFDQFFVNERDDVGSRLQCTWYLELFTKRNQLRSFNFDTVLQSKGDRWFEYQSYYVDYNIWYQLFRWRCGWDCGYKFWQINKRFLTLTI